jgi:hypothetical protein
VFSPWSEREPHVIAGVTGRRDHLPHRPGKLVLPGAGRHPGAGPVRSGDPQSGHLRIIVECA